MNDPALFHPALRHSCRIPLRSSRGAHLLHRSCVYEFHTTSVALVKKTTMVFSCRRCWNDVGTMLERCWERCWNDVGTMFYFTLGQNWQLSGSKPCKEIGTPSLKAVGEKIISIFSSREKKKEERRRFFSYYLRGLGQKTKQKKTINDVVTM